MQSLELIATHGKDSLKAIEEAERSLKPRLTEVLRWKYTELFRSLITRELPLSSVEVGDFDTEFSRLFDWYQLYLRKSSMRFTEGHPRATPLYQRATNIISTPKKYTTAIKNDLHGLLKVS
jgi:hypothetical protein